MSSQSGRNILSQAPDLMMESDASLLGWGAVHEGARTGGLWSSVERLSHINCLELSATTFAMKALSWQLPHPPEVRHAWQIMSPEQSNHQQSGSFTRMSSWA